MRADASEGEELVRARGFLLGEEGEEWGEWEGAIVIHLRR